MKILLASSEVFPFSKTGGLADMVGALAKYLARAGCQVGVVTPLYRGIEAKWPRLGAAEQVLDLPLGADRVLGAVRALKLEEGLTMYFVEQPGFYDRGGIYFDGGKDYPDNAERFLFFAKAVSFLAGSLPWKPDLVNVHDWQVGLVPLFLKEGRERAGAGGGRAPAVCLTIHNLAYQGVFPGAQYPLTNLSWDHFHPEGVEFYGMYNCLKAGIVYSDAITTVSPRYAREITTEAYGCGLDGVLRNRQAALTGILNGVDYEEWRTEGNRFLKHSYSAEDLSGKLAEKLALQRELGLPEGADIPLFGTISRLVDQKGIPIQLGALEEMLPGRMQFVLLGSGRPDYEQAFLKLAARHPGKVAARIGYDHGLSHRIEAGCDYFLMPSQFEPCGLNQMYSLRYGTVPIVRVTGGLDDSVVDVTEDVERANGIKFQAYSSRALAKAIRKALVLFECPELLAHYRRNGMSVDFSWSRTAGRYLDVYDAAVRGR